MQAGSSTGYYGLANLISVIFSPIKPVGIVASIFIITPFLQKALGYTDYPTEYYLWGAQTVLPSIKTGIINHWLVDGFFPVFPWLGFSLLGVNLGRMRWAGGAEHLSFAYKKVFLTGLGILVTGIIVWSSYPGPLLTRAGYSELFYPPTIGYILSAIGVIISLFSIVDADPSLAVYGPFRVMGESALVLYILHLVIIGCIIAPIWPDRDPAVFLLIYASLALILIFAAYISRISRKRRGR